MQLQSLTIEFILLQISVAFSPGLIIALVVNEAVQKGRKNALQVAYGAAAGAIGITIITAGVITYLVALVDFLSGVGLVGESVASGPT